MINKAEVRVKLLFLFLCVFCFSLVLMNAYADQGVDKAQAKAMEQAVTDPKAVVAENPNAVTAADYRQELGQAITVEEEYLPQALDTYGRFMPLSGVKSQSGKIGIVTAASEYNYKMKAFDKLPIQFGLVTKYIGISNTTAVQLPARLTTFGLGVETTLPFFNLEKTYFTIALAPSFYTDNWNFRSESFHLAQRYFMIYQPTDKLTLVCGAEYIPGFKAAVSPIVGLIYRPNDKLTFNLIPPMPEIDYDLNDKWTVFMQGEYVADEYKVTQNGKKNQVLNYNEIRAGAGLKYAPNKNIQASLSAGSVFNRSIEYRQDSLGKVAVNNGLYTEFRVNIAM